MMCIWFAAVLCESVLAGAAGWATGYTTAYEVGGLPGLEDIPQPMRRLFELQGCYPGY